MTFKVTLSLEAQSDLFEAIDYYYDINPKLALEFETEFQSYLDILEHSPFFEIRYDVFRAVPLKVFPYIIVFTVDEIQKSVKVYAVFHTAQNPDKYLE